MSKVLEAKAKREYLYAQVNTQLTGEDGLPYSFYAGQPVNPAHPLIKQYASLFGPEPPVEALFGGELYAEGADA